MDDLLERLRNVQHFGRADHGVRGLAGDAADEITRLTDRVEKLERERDALRELARLYDDGNQYDALQLSRALGIDDTWEAE